MSDSVDRVFVHALATVRRLPRTGSSRPPPSSRLRLYGLYKQSMEGDVATILSRPTIPFTPPDPNDPSNPSVHRYASRDLRAREAQAEIEKWDAWHACAGMSRTEAKRRYISTLVETMKEYASGTAESRELVSELEFVWNQIKSQNGSDPDDEAGGSNGSGNGSKESPTRKMERAGIGGADQMMNSFESNRPSIGSLEASGMTLSRRTTNQSFMDQLAQPPQQPTRTRTRPRRTQSGLRMLSPVSQQDADSVIEPVDAEIEDPDQPYDEEDDDDNLNTAPTSPLAHRDQDQDRGMPLPSTVAHNITPPPDTTQSRLDWQRTLEAHLHALKTEIAALREQMSANHLLSSSTFSHTYYTLSTRQRIMHRIKHYLRHYGTFMLRQFITQLGVLLLVLIWGRWKGDLRVEEWVRDVLGRFRQRMRSVASSVGFWLLDLFGRHGRLGFMGRIFRVF